MQLAIIQSIPNHPTHPVRTDSFAKFQNICGPIEQINYLAAHAACHATMNGIERTLTCDADIAQFQSIQNALQSLLKADAFDALVIPGLSNKTLQMQVCSWCQNHETNFKIFFDPPPNADPSQIIAQQKNIPHFAAYAWPWVSTITPGRRSAEWLPPSCLVAPLALHKIQNLRGVHELPTPNHSINETLAQNGVLVMHNSFQNRRPVIGLLPIPTQSGSAPIQAQISVDPRPNTIEAAITEQLNTRCFALLKQYNTNSVALWNALERAACAVLLDAKSRGLINNFYVRCDEETNDAGDPNTPVLEVQIAYPKRVQQFKLNIQRS